MAKENQLWGAERIRGELLRLGIEVSKRSIQRYMPKDRKEHSSSQSWATFLKNQTGNTWACDFTVVNDWLFRQWYIFVVMELKTRRIVYTGVTKYPTDEWTAQPYAKRFKPIQPLTPPANLPPPNPIPNLSHPPNSQSGFGRGVCGTEWHSGACAC
jgi:hypothetical protein